MDPGEPRAHGGRARPLRRVRGRAQGQLRSAAQQGHRSPARGERGERGDRRGAPARRAGALVLRFLYLLGEQAELTAYRVADQPEARQLHRTLEAVEEASSVFAARAESLQEDFQRERDGFFERLAAEREAAIEQARAGFAHVVADSLDDLAARQDQLHGILSELRETIRISGDLATGLTGTVEAIDRVVSRFDRDPEDADEPLRMEDVRDAAIEAQVAARELTHLLETADALVASDALDRRAARLAEPAKEIVDRAFWRGLVLAGLFVGGVVLALRFGGAGRMRSAPGGRARTD